MFARRKSLVLVHGLTSPSCDDEPKRFFSQRFPSALVDDFYLLGSDVTGRCRLQTRATELLETLLYSRAVYEVIRHHLQSSRFKPRQA